MGLHNQYVILMTIGWLVTAWEYVEKWQGLLVDFGEKKIVQPLS